VSDLQEGRRTNTPAGVRLKTTEACLDLLAIGDPISENGRLLPGEVAALNEWLATYTTGALVTQDQIVSTLQRVLSVGMITDSERVALRSAIDRGLPPDTREAVRTVRKPGPAKRMPDDVPIDSYRFIVAGTRELERSTHISRYAFEGDEVLLVRDSKNARSRSAVIVRLLAGFDIGYVSELDARTMAPHLDENLPYIATIKRVVRGGRVPIPVIAADFFRGDARVDGARRPRDRVGSAALAHFTKTPPQGNARAESTTSYRAVLLIGLIALFAILVLLYV
jgi:HIRAN domain